MHARCGLIHKKLNEQGIKICYVGVNTRTMLYTFGRNPRMYYQEYTIEHRGRIVTLEVKATGRIEYFITTPDEKVFEVVFSQKDAIAKITSILNKEI